MIYRAPLFRSFKGEGVFSGQYWKRIISILAVDPSRSSKVQAAEPKGFEWQEAPRVVCQSTIRREISVKILSNDMNIYRLHYSLTERFEELVGQVQNKVLQLVHPALFTIAYKCAKTTE